jgi:hypothetical protein
MIQRKAGSVLLLFILCLLGVSQASFSQSSALFHLKDGSTQQANILATSKTSVFINGGSIELNKLASVELSSDKYLKYFTDNNIPATVNGSIVPIAPVSPVVVESPESDIETLYYGLEKFRAQSVAGKGLQLTGILLVGVSAIIVAQKNPNGDVALAFSAGGVACSFIGFIVDMNANKHLKFKRRRSR